MILGFRHKGLRPCYEKDDSSKLQPHHTGKIRLILTRLDAATGPEIMNEPGYRLHGLSGGSEGHWSVRVDRNHRITFRFDGENADDVDYADYH